MKELTLKEVKLVSGGTSNAQAPAPASVVKDATVPGIYGSYNFNAIGNKNNIFNITY
ncbi:hypothetical protein [Providencia stuartii]|uniref:hypothetical protein n=1 Tax=Providencia stuartii TaxID=588 RepID=UPI002DBECC55|nr:hypothetical protein [Providencia stuartii]WRV50018.1 hypothetical protein VQ573_09830 [Providencia stuartii]